MKTLKFPKKDIVYISTEHSEVINNHKFDSSAKNGLVNSIIRAYNNHNILTISPDDVMNNICCVWAKYVFLNAEKFRKQIVTHEGKKTLTILTKQNEVWDDDLLIDHMSQYIKLINDDQKSIQWMDVEFTTSSKLDKMIRQVATLSSQKAYYEYHSRTLCWLPLINILGEDEDWKKIFSQIGEMPCFDDQMRMWKEKLLKVIGKFVEADETDLNFWQAPLTYNPGGSGSIPCYSGWITVFNPFNEKGVWGKQKKAREFGDTDDDNKISDYYYVPTEDIVDLTVDFEIICEDQFGERHGQLNVFAGPTAIRVSPEMGVQPQNKLSYNYIKDK